MIDVLSFGAGVQSTTLLYMSCDGVLPKLDAVIFADTQWEPKAVYVHLERCKEKAAKAGIEVIVATAGNIRADLLRKFSHGERSASLPLYVKSPKKEDRGIMPRQCTKEYKIEVVDKQIRNMLGLKRGQHWPKTPAVRLWIGISLDEIQRRRTSMRPGVEFNYPLLDVLKVNDQKFLYPRGFTRADCLEWMRTHGYDAPPRSACIGCPFHSDEEWARLKAESPAEFEDACEVDRLIRKFDTERLGERGQLVGSPFLHSSLIPLEMVQFDASKDANEGRGMTNECQGMCGL